MTPLAPVIVADVEVRLVNAPVEAVVAPIVVPLIVPPVIATLLALCVDIVPKPDMSVLGMLAEAVKAEVPLPLTYPVKVVAPVPPFETTSVPARVRVPLVVIGLPEKVRPVVPPEAETEVTVPPAAGVAETVIPPAVLLMLTLVPAVSVLSV